MATSPRSVSGSATSPIPRPQRPAGRERGGAGGLDIWIVDALRYHPHPSHFSVAEALDWIERLKPRRAILTNMHADLDYDELRARLPPHVEPAYDGMQIELSKAANFIHM